MSPKNPAGQPSRDGFCPSATLAAGQEHAGFRITRVTPVPEIRATAYEARHLATGARFLHLHCDDRENLYAITFRTPPPDSTGVAHILEHSTLAGSRHFPVKDAFNELVKSTLNTFINAFTAPDFTCYPICSQVRADFYNLARVYTDLALRPLLKRQTFMREGHHLELTEAGALSISGIVYNEMKGAFSVPERVSYSSTLQGLFPDTPYGVESGGTPEDIPKLTHEQFCEFHRRYYSPSNACLFLYGDIPTRDHLEFLAQQLEAFAAIEIDSRVPLQPRWGQPRTLRAEYPVGEGDPIERRATVNVAWLTAAADDLEERLALEVLHEALIGNAAAPLRRALIDSGLGEDLSPLTGLASWYKQLPFVVGLRGTDEGQADAIEKLALETLERICREGIPRDLLEGAFHQVEFKGLEITRAPLPFPLTLLFRAMGTWLHELDPLVPLTFPTLIASLRERWIADPKLFEGTIRRWMLDNPHRLRAVIAPSRTLAGEREAKLASELAARKNAMSEAELAEIRRTMEALTEEQRTPDPPEAVATLPKLQIAEIPREVETIPTVEQAIDGVPALEHDLFSNGVAYLDLVFDVADVPEDLQPYLPLLGAAATGMGAAGAGYAAFASRKALALGELAADLDAGERLADGAPVQRFVLRARALRRNIPEMIAIVRDILIAGDLDDHDRLEDILAEERNQLRASIAPNGHAIARLTAAARLSLASWRNEQWFGVSQVRFLNGQAGTYGEKGEALRARLAELRQRVLTRGRMLLNLTGDAACVMEMQDALRGLVAALPAGGEVSRVTGAAVPPGAPRGVAIPGEVCYVARVLPVPRHNAPEAPALWVLSNYLRTGHLYKKIRVEGGAYGGLCLYDTLKGQLGMMSYRDPNLERTLEVYDATVDAFLAERLEPDAMRTAIVGAVGRLDRPMDPAEKGYEAMRRRMIGLTDDDRRRFRAGVLATTAEQLRACADGTLRRAMTGAPQAVLAKRERIEEANRTLATAFVVEGIE